MFVIQVVICSRYASSDASPPSPPPPLPVVQICPPLPSKSPIRVWQSVLFNTANLGFDPERGYFDKSKKTTLLDLFQRAGV